MNEVERLMLKNQLVLLKSKVSELHDTDAEDTKQDIKEQIKKTERMLGISRDNKYNNSGESAYGDNVFELWVRKNKNSSFSVSDISKGVVSQEDRKKIVKYLNLDAISKEVDILSLLSRAIAKVNIEGYYESVLIGPSGRIVFRLNKDDMNSLPKEDNSLEDENFEEYDGLEEDEEDEEDDGLEEDDSFYWLVSELIRDNLVITYHLNTEELCTDYFNIETVNDLVNGWHEHDFESLLVTVAKEPYAVYFTKEDESSLSEQELRMVKKLQEYMKANYTKEQLKNCKNIVKELAEKWEENGLFG